MDAVELKGEDFAESQTVLSKSRRDVLVFTETVSRPRCPYMAAGVTVCLPRKQNDAENHVHVFHNIMRGPNFGDRPNTLSLVSQQNALSLRRRLEAAVWTRIYVYDHA